MGAKPAFNPGQDFEADPVRNTLFPKRPKDPDPPPPVPQASDDEVEAARDEERKKRKRKKGRKSTILTSELGDTTDPTLEKKTLLGG